MLTLMLALRDTTVESEIVTFGPLLVEAHRSSILIGGTMQARYQYGDLRIRKRNKGPDVWQFRYFEDGRRKSVLVGTLEKLPTKADAQRAVEHLRIQVNAQSSQQQFHSVTVGGLIDR